jgi:hypothetical protein
MQLSEIKIGDYLINDTDPALSGPVVGVDECGPVSPPGPCVWIDNGTGTGWIHVGRNEIGSYAKRK